MTHICVSKLTTFGSDIGLSPGRHQDLIWTNAGILLIEHIGRNFNEISIKIHTFSLKNLTWRGRLENGGLSVLTLQPTFHLHTEVGYDLYRMSFAHLMGEMYIL